MIEVRIKPARQLFPKNNEDSENFFFIYSADVIPEDQHLVKLNSYNNISFKGISPKLTSGQEYIALLKEDPQSKYAGSYILEAIKQKKPETILEQKNFLQTLLTENQINNIYSVYSEKDDVVGMIERNEFEYSKISGLGEKTFAKLQEKVLSNLDMSEVLSFCNKFEIKYNMIAKLVKEYKNPQIVIEKIKENPYMLTEVKGIGFKKADEIAKAVGYNMNSPHRIESAIKYIIREENQSGHSWITYRTLLNRAIELLNVDKLLIESTLDGNIKDVISVDQRYTTKAVYDAEKSVAMNMTKFKTNSKKLFTDKELEEFLNKYCEDNDVELEENQRQFFFDWNENNILLLIGGGGMGKSWLQRILLELIDKKNLKTALLAPTGKASKVMTNYTGRQASTIHRKAGVFEDGQDGVKEIYEDILIIDEASMCDVFILQKLFKALKNENARILFVGDDFQLPSVGVGNFLYDTINSLHIKVSKLKKVFRQAEGGILNVATDVREGNVFLNETDQGRMVFGRDCVFWLVDSDYVKDGVLTNYKNSIEKFGVENVVVLTPTNKGRLGTIELNKEIQKIANPPSANKREKSVGAKGFETIFRVGDSVMNIVNSYDMETTDEGTADVFNGDTGKIVDIDEEEKVYIVEFDGIKVKMKFGTILTNLVHSWVTTIHKSQGSQYDVVILIADKSMTFQLNANLLYTGLSRAKRFLLVLSQAKTINMCMRKHANMERRSFMQELLDFFNKSESENVNIYDEESL